MLIFRFNIASMRFGTRHGPLHHPTLPWRKKQPTSTRSLSGSSPAANRCIIRPVSLEVTHCLILARSRIFITIAGVNIYFFFDNLSLFVWWADEIRPYIFFVYLHPTPPTKCKTHQIWATLNWISGAFKVFFFCPKKFKLSQNCTNMPPGRPTS